MAAAAAAGAAHGAGDSTLTWAFERLVDCPAVPVHVLTDTLLPAVASGLADLPDCTRARLCLRLVDSDLQESRVDETTLEYLRELAACDVAAQADAALVRPSPELMLQVKTAAGLEALSLPPAEAENLLNTVFGGPAGVPLTAEEWTRYQELLGALHNPAAAAALRARYPIQTTALQLTDFVHTASSALPCLLLTVQADIAAGRYVPGAMPQPAAPAAQPRRNLLPSPGRVPPPRPPPEVEAAAALQQLPGAAAAAAAAAGEYADVPSMDEGYVSAAEQPPAPQQEVVRQLHRSLDNLQQQGGEDPLRQTLVDAQQAAQEAGPAAVAAARQGRTIQWEEDTPGAAPPPRLPRVEPQHHSPLPQSARRRAGQAPVAVADSGGGEARRMENGRRKPKRWDNEEEAALVRLVKKHGRGNWALILKDGIDSGEIDKDRKQGDMKDKWRNLIKQNRIQPHEITEIEAREQELRQEPRKGPGRPPKFVSPGGAAARKRRRGSVYDEEEEGEGEEEMEDAVENADEEDEQAADEGEEEEEEEEAGEEDEAAEEEEAGEAAAEEEADQHPSKRRSRRKPSKGEPQRRQTRSQDAAAERGDRGGRGKGRARG